MIFGSFGFCAGHYVPQLMALIHERNKSAKLKINLKGMMVSELVKYLSCVTTE